MSLIRQTRNQYLSSWNNLLNNFLSRLMFQYSFVLKSITCIIYLIEKETSSEKIEKLYELSLILKSHACSIVTQNVIERFSVTIDCVRFLIRGFPLYTYSMIMSHLPLNYGINASKNFLPKVLFPKDHIIFTPSRFLG